MSTDISNEKYTCSRLEWDTKFFGIKSVRFDFKETLTLLELKTVLELSAGYQFVCITNLNGNVENARLIAKHTDAFVADTNVQLVKKMPTEQECIKQLFDANKARSYEFKISNGYAYDASIVEMAGSIYTSSRFLADARLAARNGKDIYVEWIKNSFGKVEKYFIVHKNAQERTDAFLLYSMNGCTATIELIGVEQQAQNKGLGRELWVELEAQIANSRIVEIHVGTQITNTAAIALYTSMGCRLVESKQVYHWWNEHSPQCMEKLV